MTRYDKIKKMINRIKEAAPVGHFDYIDNVKIDLLIPIQKKETAEMKLFDFCLKELIISGQMEVAGNRIRLNN